MKIALDSLSSWQAAESVRPDDPVAEFFDRGLVVSLLIFSLAVPHSIAAAQISYLTGLIFWFNRNIRQGVLARREASPRRRPPERALKLIEIPLCGFLLLTLLSSLFSYDPVVSLTKSRSIGLFIIFYLISLNLTRRGAIAIICCLLASSLCGVGYSLAEKAVGRGMVIEFIEPDSPLSNRGLQPGDVIWMVGRRRVRSLEEARQVVARHKEGDRVEIEALHAGDPVPPVPVSLVVTEDLRRTTEAFGIRVGRTTRQFRISGFTRQFITYAEQMQLFGLLLLGLLINGRGSGQRWRPWALLGLMLFVAGLVLTATRSVIASFVGALILVSIRFGGKRTISIALLGAVIICGLGIAAVVTSRREMMGRFGDESTSRRVEYMKAGLRVATRHPLLGIGLDSHKRFWKEWGFPGDYVTHTHSTPVQVAMDRGFPALFFLIWVGVAAWIGLGRIRVWALVLGDHLGAGLATGAMAALLGFSLSALINYNFGDSEALMQLLAIIGAAGAIGADLKEKAHTETISSLSTG